MQKKRTKSQIERYLYINSSYISHKDIKEKHMYIYSISDCIVKIAEINIRSLSLLLVYAM